MADPVAVSLVVPVLDEGATLEELVERSLRTLERTAASFELVVVDDGSSPADLEVARTVAGREPRCRLIELVERSGQLAALVCGIRATTGAVVVTMDGDLQDDPEDVERLVRALDDPSVHVAVGHAANRHRAWWRRAGSRAVNQVAGWLTGVRLQDFGGQFNAYRRDTLDRALARWEPGTPLLPLVCRGRPAVVEVPVANHPRPVGRSRYGLGQLLRISGDLLASLSTRPVSVGVPVLIAVALAAVVVAVTVDPALPAASAGVVAAGALAVAAWLVAAAARHRRARRRPAYVERPR